MIDALLPKTRQRILALLLSRPDEAFYLREIVRTTEASKGAVDAELKGNGGQPPDFAVKHAKTGMAVPGFRVSG